MKYNYLIPIKIILPIFFYYTKIRKHRQKILVYYGTYKVINRVLNINTIKNKLQFIEIIK